MKRGFVQILGYKHGAKAELPRHFSLCIISHFSE